MFCGFFKPDTKEGVRFVKFALADLAYTCGVLILYVGNTTHVLMHVFVCWRKNTRVLGMFTPRLPILHKIAACFVFREQSKRGPDSLTSCCAPP